MRQFAEETIIEKTALLMFDSLGSTDIVLAAVAPDGSCIASNPEVFGRVFEDRRLLKAICSRVDDGQELVISQAQNCAVAACDVLCDGEFIGYAIMLLPECSPEKLFEYIDFVEIILNQFSTAAGLAGRSSRAFGLSQKVGSSESVDILAGVN